MRHLPAALAALVLAVLAGPIVLVGLIPDRASAGDGAAGSGWTPPPDTIVAVEGDRANGFTITYFDGSSISPPTDSEARAECNEYDTQVQRVRCHAEVRTWYRSLRDLRRALRYAHLQATAGSVTPQVTGRAGG